MTVFYILGTRYLGVWSPAEMTDYSNSFSTAMPWIYPLLVGLSASTLEEFFFRLLAISLLLKVTKKRWIAVLLPAAVWAFLHSSYPVEPVYTRGLELTVVGVVLGVVFLRYGIWTTVISHYAYNAFLGAIPMLKSSSLYFQVSGLAVVGILLLPAVPAIVGTLTGRYRADVEEEEAEAPTPTDGGALPEPLPAAEAPPAQKRLEDVLPGSREWKIAGMLAIAGAVLIAGFYFGRVAPFGKRTLSFTVTRAGAVRLAGAFCEEIGLDLAGYRHAAWFSSSLGSKHFVHLVRKVGVARADTLASEETDPWVWTVRWFRPLQKEAYRVGVNTAGRIALFEHALPDSQAGADLSADSARVLVQGFVSRHFGRALTDTSRYRLLEAQSKFCMGAGGPEGGGRRISGDHARAGGQGGPCPSEL